MNNNNSSFPENDYRSYLAHSAKGTTWGNHRYIRIENGRYIYPEDLNKGGNGVTRSNRPRGRQVLHEQYVEPKNQPKKKGQGLGLGVMSNVSDADWEKRPWPTSKKTSSGKNKKPSKKENNMIKRKKLYDALSSSLYGKKLKK